MTEEQEQTKFKNDIINIYKKFIIKENEFLHYKRYSYYLLHFENYLRDCNLLKDALEVNGGNIRNFEFLKKKLKKNNREYLTINDELTYKAYYQMFEEFISESFQILFLNFPIFLKKDNHQFELDFESIFLSTEIEVIQNHIIEKKVKSIIQSNNIINSLKKYKSTFGLDIKFDERNLKQLFFASMNRNILTHNSGIVNTIYLQELKNQKIESDYKIGDSIYPLLYKHVSSLSKVVNIISEQIYNKISTSFLQLNNYSYDLKKTYP